ncbi:hypothetical protein FRACYDRAFT_231864 [Fragilariopsis cylindrus CCMP1102]|uniref:PhyH-domain-containing protein n=1 Tax=Fragilariopsis cylindrus CCMP1102 TaxID=635003 RepID=A0A1E7FU78_9STRA|nr:hypothetical protein FRACYDRAFT_231864 [Fragilariopsis cylindrus CCMP1102]|eukprot:OEU21720.1 hypothetical protein FRACYDRAFT_231864 [Fragilariopsis cylindrus CCMP1102]
MIVKKNSGTNNISIRPIGFSGNYSDVKALQIINIHKADTLYRKLETNIDFRINCCSNSRSSLEEKKPPGASSSLVFHRDTPYFFMFERTDVIAVWIELDDTTKSIVPLEYVVRSHLWGDVREGIKDFDTQLKYVSVAGLKKGELSIHDGKIWHGSNSNSSKR